MKIERIDKKVKVFKPVTFEITLESIEEVRALLAELNGSDKHIDTQLAKLGFQRHYPSHYGISGFYSELSGINDAYEEQQNERD